MQRNVFDRLVSGAGAALVIILLIAGGLLALQLALDPAVDDGVGLPRGDQGVPRPRSRCARAARRGCRRTRGSPSGRSGCRPRTYQQPFSNVKIGNPAINRSEMADRPRRLAAAVALHARSPPLRQL